MSRDLDFGYWAAIATICVSLWYIINFVTP